MGKEGRIERGSNEEGWRRLRASQKISQRYFPRFTFPKDGITLNVKVVGRVNFEGDVLRVERKEKKKLVAREGLSR